jgi:hypothetical protein
VKPSVFSNRARVWSERAVNEFVEVLQGIRIITPRNRRVSPAIPTLASSPFEPDFKGFWSAWVPNLHLFLHRSGRPVTKLIVTGIARPQTAYAEGRVCCILGNRGNRDEGKVWIDEAPVGRLLRQGQGDGQTAEPAHQ